MRALYKKHSPSSILSDPIIIIVHHWSFQKLAHAQSYCSFINIALKKLLYKYKPETWTTQIRTQGPTIDFEDMKKIHLIKIF